jgi:hypothetical protein
MIYPDDKPEVWAKRYSIDVSPRPCEQCGVMVVPDIPYAYKDWRGLMSKDHGCGEKYVHMSVVSVNPESRKFWADLYNHIGEENE